MSQFNIYLKLPDYLDQWLRHEFWNEDEGRVCFPKQSVENLLLDRFLRKRPAGMAPELAGEDGSLPVKVPTFPGRNPASFNYLPPPGRRALAGAIRRRFKLLLRTELDGFDPRLVQITDLIEAFADKHGIERDPRNWESIRQMYYRMRRDEDRSVQSGDDEEC